MDQDIEISEKLKMYKDSFNSTEQFIAILNNDMTIIDANKALLDLIGHDTLDICDVPYWELPLWEHSTEIQNLIMFSFESIYLGEEVKFETTYLDENDEIKYLEFTIKPIYDEMEEIDSLIAMGYDVTNIKNTQIKLLEAEEELEIFFNSGLDGYMIRKLEYPIELNSDNHNIVVDTIFSKEKVHRYNEAFKDIMQIPEVFYNGKDLFANAKIYINNESLTNIFLESLNLGYKKIELNFIADDKSKRYVEITIKPVITNGYYMGCFYIVQDVTKEKMHQDELFKMANFDALTSVANRRYFINQVEKITSLNDFEMGVMCLFDIDNFKSVNDNFGHDIGDVALKNIAWKINEKVENLGIFARMGGEEFSAFFMCDLQTTKEVLDEIMQDIRESLITIDKLSITLKITVSAGITVVKKGDIFNDFFKNADNALYEAKSQGRNRYIVSKES